MNEERIIKAYFQKIAEDYDAIYSKQKNFLYRFLDFIFRRSMQKRFEVALRECGDFKGKTIVDIGCGSGRYCVELARRGARQVVGIDFAENMLKLARDLADSNGVSHICQFIKADFLNYNFENKFDICIAVGVLEYLKDPKIFLARMRSITQDKIIISLPVKWMFRSGLRKIRLTLKGCPVYFYTKGKIERLLKGCQLKDYKIMRLDRDYLIMIKV